MPRRAARAKVLIGGAGHAVAAAVVGGDDGVAAQPRDLGPARHGFAFPERPCSPRRRRRRRPRPTLRSLVSFPRSPDQPTKICARVGFAIFISRDRRDNPRDREKYIPRLILHKHQNISGDISLEIFLCILQQPEYLCEPNILTSVAFYLSGKIVSNFRNITRFSQQKFKLIFC